MNFITQNILYQIEQKKDVKGYRIIIIDNKK